MVEGAGRAREGRVEGSLNSDSDRSLCSMRDCVNVYACESASVLSRPSLPLHRAFARARARTLAPPQPCAAVVNESCQREREREGGGRGREKKREMAKERRGRKGRRIGGGREREREGSIRPGQSVTMSLV